MKSCPGYDGGFGDGFGCDVRQCFWTFPLEDPASTSRKAGRSFHIKCSFCVIYHEEKVEIVIIPNSNRIFE